MRVWIMLLWGVALICSPASYADVEQMLLELKSIEAEPERLAETLSVGLERASLCVHCHGKDGNSRRDYIPNLAAQHPEYLLTQFEHFASGRRQDYVMSKLAQGLSTADRIAVALYFSQQAVSVRDNTAPSGNVGNEIYKQSCIACHGEKGHGDAHYPRIASQPYEFLAQTLLDFLANSAARQNSPMSAVVTSMSAEQLQAVAAFVSNMP